MNNNTELDQISQEILNNMHKTVDATMNHPDFKATTGSYQDTTNMYFVRKLAEYELRLRRLEKGNARTQSFISRNTPLK